MHIKISFKEILHINTFIANVFVYIKTPLVLSNFPLILVCFVRIPWCPVLVSITLSKICLIQDDISFYSWRGVQHFGLKPGKFKPSFWLKTSPHKFNFVKKFVSFRMTFVSRASGVQPFSLKPGSEVEFWGWSFDITKW